MSSKYMCGNDHQYFVDETQDTESVPCPECGSILKLYVFQESEDDFS